VRDHERRGVTVAVATTQWIIAVGSLGSALVAVALGLGLGDWMARPRVSLVLRRRSGSDADDVSDRIVTRRIDTGDTAAFVRLRIDNQGRSTARNVGVRLLQVWAWDRDAPAWVRARAELDGRLLQPSNHLPDEPDTVDVFPYSDRIVDLVSVGAGDGRQPICLEINHPWPPSGANLLAPGEWRLELLVCGDNIKAKRYYLTVALDGNGVDIDSPDVWDHFVVDGPWTEAPEAPASAGAATWPQQQRPLARDGESPRRGPGDA